ncbi:MAG: radical SAM protein [Deltaproteobacteria bacterium]|nr:radical SAM protein [Deltaproteobacteria bacterium]
MKPSLILINPWIYDFAAYDLWSKPLGLLSLATEFRRRGFCVHLMDCMDVDHPAMIKRSSLKPPKRRQYGTGKFWRQIVPKPLALKETGRPYSRYGLLPEIFEEGLRRVKNPSAILVTSLMTYWYPGVFEAIRRARKIHPEVPVILGGVYARLCREHAIQFSGADRVVSKQGILAIYEILKDFEISIPNETLDAGMPGFPAFDLLGKIHYICLMTSTGCPYRCHYCASHFLFPGFVQKDPDEVLEEILHWHRTWGIRDFAFYDDALLVSWDNHLRVLLDHIARLNLPIRFHTPNAIHVREITKSVARLLHQTGFQTIRLGLEVSDGNKRWNLDNKLSKDDFANAMDHLLSAGFDPRQIGAYIMMGMPGQSPDVVAETIHQADRCGSFPYLAEYSPIPHTRLWEKAVSHSTHDLSSEPLFHNNSLLPCWDSVQKKEVPRLKQQVSRVREKYR